jgi:hypothetical protein
VAELRSALLHNIACGFRLALFRPVSRTDFRVGAVEYAALAVFNVLVWIAGSYMRSGSEPQFVPLAIPALLAYIPVTLLFCLVAARLLRDDSLFIAFAVMLASADLFFELVGSLIYLSLEAQWLPLPAPGQFGLYVAYVLWVMATGLRTQLLLAPWRTPGARVVAALFLGMVLLLLYIPRQEPWVAIPAAEESSQPSLLQEEVFHAQDGLLGRELDRLSAQRPGEPDLYFLGVAPYGLQDTFLRELSTVHKLLEESFDTAGRSLLLINHPGTLTAAPLATATNLRMALKELGESLNVQEDVLMLFLTTHGSAGHALSFELPPLQLQQVNPTALARMLADSGIKWKIIVISACYSGGFIEALRDDNTLILTASDATHSSFGCEAGSDFTWFSKAYFDQALREQAKQGSYSFTAAFERAKVLVAEREKAAGYEPSNPQIHLGNAMRDKLKDLEARLAQRAPAAPIAAGKAR